MMSGNMHTIGMGKIHNIGMGKIHNMGMGKMGSVKVGKIIKKKKIKSRDCCHKYIKCKERNVL